MIRIMNRLGFTMLLIAAFISFNSCCQNFFWSHTGEITPPTIDTCLGYLYNWYAVDNSTGDTLTSSDDWSVSSQADWLDVIAYAGNASTAAFKLKSTDTIYWDSPSPSATDEYGFSAIGSGFRQKITGVFSGVFNQGHWWTSTQKDSDESYKYQMFSGEDGRVFQGDIEWDFGASVRLTKDATGLADGVTTTYTGNDGKEYDAIVINEIYWTTENLEESKYRDDSWIAGYDGGVYTPISDVAWAALITGALCLYEDNLNYECK